MPGISPERRSICVSSSVALACLSDTITEEPVSCDSAGETPQGPAGEALIKRGLPSDQTAEVHASHLPVSCYISPSSRCHSNFYPPHHSQSVFFLTRTNSSPSLVSVFRYTHFVFPPIVRSWPVFVNMVSHHRAGSLWMYGRRPGKRRAASLEFLSFYMSSFLRGSFSGKNQVGYNWKWKEIDSHHVCVHYLRNTIHATHFAPSWAVIRVLDVPIPHMKEGQAAAWGEQPDKHLSLADFLMHHTPGWSKRAGFVVLVHTLALWLLSQPTLMWKNLF